MPVPSSMSDLATLASSNSPAGTDPVGNNMDNYLRALAAILRSTNATDTLAAATTTDLTTVTAESVSITGSGVTITSLGSAVPGLYRELLFAAANTLSHSSNLQLPNSANITTKAGDVFGFRSLGSGQWKLVSKTRLTGNDGIFGSGEEELTISGGSVTPSGKVKHLIIRTEGAASTDNLDTVNLTNLLPGDLVLIRSGTASETVTVRDNGTSGGNINIPSNVSLAIQDVNGYLLFRVNPAATLLEYIGAATAKSLFNNVTHQLTHGASGATPFSDNPYNATLILSDSFGDGQGGLLINSLRPRVTLQSLGASSYAYALDVNSQSFAIGVDTNRDGVLDRNLWSAINNEGGIRVYRASGSTGAAVIVASSNFGGTDVATFLVRADGDVEANSIDAAGYITAVGGITGSSIGGGMIADQPEMEASAVTNRIVTPGRLIYHPGAVKKWGVFSNGAGSPPTTDSSYNISSIVRNSTGNYTINFSSFSSSNFCIEAFVGASTWRGIYEISRTSSSITIQVVRFATAGIVAADFDRLNVALLGDL